MPGRFAGFLAALAVMAMAGSSPADAEEAASFQGAFLGAGVLDFREAARRLAEQRDAEAVAFLARAIERDPGNATVQTAAWSQLAARRWPVRVAEFLLPGREVDRVLLQENGRRLAAFAPGRATGMPTGMLRVWDAPSAEPLVELEGDPQLHQVYARAGKLLVFHGYKQGDHSRFIDWSADKPTITDAGLGLREDELVDPGARRVVQLDARGLFVLSAAAPGRSEVETRRIGAPEAEAGAGPERGAASLVAGGFLDGDRVIAVTSDGTVRIWKLAGKEGDKPEFEQQIPELRDREGEGVVVYDRNAASVFVGREGVSLYAFLPRRAEVRRIDLSRGAAGKWKVDPQTAFPKGWPFSEGRIEAVQLSPDASCALVVGSRVIPDRHGEGDGPAVEELAALVPIDRPGNGLTWVLDGGGGGDGGDEGAGESFAAPERLRRVGSFSSDGALFFRLDGHRVHPVETKSFTPYAASLALPGRATCVAACKMPEGSRYRMATGAVSGAVTLWEFTAPILAPIFAPILVAGQGREQFADDQLNLELRSGAILSRLAAARSDVALCRGTETGLERLGVFRVGSDFGRAGSRVEAIVFRPGAAEAALVLGEGSTSGGPEGGGVNLVNLATLKNGGGEPGERSRFLENPFSRSACFSPDGRYLIAGGERAVVFDAAHPEGDAPLASAAGWLDPIPLTPSRVLFVHYPTGTGRLRTLPALAPLGVPLRIDGPVSLSAVSPDGKRLALLTSPGTLTIWDATTGLPVTPGLAVCFPAVGMEFDARGDLRVFRIREGKSEAVEAAIEEMTELLSLNLLYEEETADAAAAAAPKSWDAVRKAVSDPSLEALPVLKRGGKDCLNRPYRLCNEKPYIRHDDRSRAEFRRLLPGAFGVREGIAGSRAVGSWSLVDAALVETGMRIPTGSLAARDPLALVPLLQAVAGGKWETLADGADQWVQSPPISGEARAALHDTLRRLGE